MSIKSTLIDIAVVFVVAAAAAGAAYVKGNVDGVQSQNKVVLAAQQDTQTAKDNAAKATTALNVLRAQLAQQKQALTVAQTVATAALDQRDQATTQLAKATAARIAAERKLANETPDCSDLQHLPICPELAHRLFGQPAQTAGAAATANHGH